MVYIVNGRLVIHDLVVYNLFYDSIVYTMDCSVLIN